MKLNEKLLKDIYQEYLDKRDRIIEEYAAKDGFMIKNSLWWDYYKDVIDTLLKKIENDTFTLEDASNFYKEFGFGPKLYKNSFLENGLDKLKELFRFLADDSVAVDRKIREITDDPENDHSLKGVGINFVTLFLTSKFPTKYMQWNSQIDSALKIIGAYPHKERGEKKSNFYLKINSVCIEIGKLLGEPWLPIIDNILFCISRGYIGKNKQIDKKIEKEAYKIEKEANIQETYEETSTHTEMMYYLIKIGYFKGYDVWVALNDRNKSHNTENFADITCNEIPNFTQLSTIGIAKYIDVIWFKKNTSHPVRFFEIEHSTSIYSGLLRLNDVKIDYPISRATIVIPKKRKTLFETQIARRTFKYSELSEVCDHMIYDDLRKWYDAVKVDSHYK